MNAPKTLTTMRWTDEQAEQAVLAAPLMTESVETNGRCASIPLRKMAAIVRPEDFSEPRHATIWEAMLAVDARGEPIDVRTVSAELTARRRLNTVGGPQYLLEVIEALPTAAHCEAHARIVAKAAKVRRRREACVAQLAEIDGGEHGAEETLVRLDRLAAGSVERRAATGTSARDHAIAAGEMIFAALQARAAGRRTAARFGVTCLDGAADGSHAGLLGGILSTRVVTVSGPPGGGKTTLVTQAAITTAEDGGQVLWFSTEVPGPELVIRYACQHAGEAPDRNGVMHPPISQVAALSGVLTEPTPDRPRARDEVSEMIDGINRFADLPMHIWSEDLSIEAIAAEVSAACAKGEVRLVVIDYFQDLDASGKESETAEQRHRAKVIKSIARNNRVGVLVVSSTTKAAQRDRAAGKRAQTSDVNGAGINYASDVIIEVAQVGDDRGDEVDVKLTITKARYGSTGDPTLRFNKPRGRFTEAGGARGVADDFPSQSYGDAE